MSIDSLIKKALSKQPMIKPSRTKKRAQVTTWRECSTFHQQQCRVIAYVMGVYCLQIDRQTRGKLGYANTFGKQRAA